MKEWGGCDISVGESMMNAGFKISAVLRKIHQKLETNADEQNLSNMFVAIV